MKKLLFAGLILAHFSTAVEIGSSRDTVLTELGEPQGSMKSGDKEILLFKAGTVTLKNGSVAETDLSQEYVRQTEARELELRQIQAAKKTGLEKQKRLFPEDHVTRIDCTYSKTENWSGLPESIRPVAGEYRYDLYIPQSYYESGQHVYPCLLLESPALWDSVKERVRKEKWIVVILHDAAGQQPGKTMNGNFLAAYDDAVERFRISRKYIFIAGRVPAAIFAAMRPVAGIILQEPDFSGFEKAGFGPGFLRENPDLRAYVLIGNKDRANMDYQAKFIITRFPEHFIGVYEGSTALLPQPFADQAVDWMKKQYNLP